jgi:hypothetical protein
MIDTYGLTSLNPVYLPAPVDTDHPLNHKRLAWWLTLPELAGGQSWYDIMGLYPGTLQGMGATAGWRTTTRPGAWGSVLFDGTSGHDVLITSSFTTLALTGGPLSIAAWVNTSSNNVTLVSHMPNGGSFSGWEMTCGQGVTLGHCGFWNGSGWVQGGTVFSDGNWHRVIVTNNGTTTSFYLDGKPDGSSAHAGPNAPSAGLFLGSRAGGSSAPLSGSLDDVSIWGRVLSPLEARQDYDLSRQGYPGVLNRMSAAFYSIPSGVSGLLLARRRRLLA